MTVNQLTLLMLNHRQADAARLSRGVVNALGGLLIIPWMSQKNIGNELLRVSIVEREPGGLDLDHHAVAFQKDMIVIAQGDIPLQRLIRY